MFYKKKRLLDNMEQLLQEESFEEESVIEISRDEVYSILADLQSLREMVMVRKA